MLGESKEHAKQLKKLAEENQVPWESLDNLVSVKTVMQDHLVKAEEELGQLRSWQEQLVEKHGEFQSRMSEQFARIELVIKEMLTKPVVGPEFVHSKSPFSVSAPVYVPTTGST